MNIITVCGSGKNRNYIHALCKKMKQKGYVVLEPPLHDMGRLSDGADEEGELLLWKGATFSHFNRIETADICIMANPGGYLGNGSTLELGYAVAKGKLVIALRHDRELARESLFDIVLECEDMDQVVESIDHILNQTQMSFSSREYFENTDN